MGELLNIFPPRLRERLLAYAQEQDNFKDVIGGEELKKTTPFKISYEQWIEVAELILSAEVQSLTRPAYEPTQKTKEVDEVTRFFVTTWHAP